MTALYVMVAWLLDGTNKIPNTTEMHWFLIIGLILCIIHDLNTVRDIFR